MKRRTPEGELSYMIARTVNESMVQSSSARYYYPWRRTYSSVDTPNFKLAKMFKSLKTNPYSMSIERCQPQNCDFVTFEVIPGYPPFFRMASSQPSFDFTGTSPFSLLPPDLEQSVRNRAFQRMSKQFSSVRVNVAQFFGERRQTAEMFASTANRIASAARALKRADLKTFSKSLGLSGTETRSAKQAWRAVENTPSWKRIPNYWLEYVYGWKPLLSDVHAAAELLAEKVVGQPVCGNTKVSASLSRRVESLSPRSGFGHITVDNRATYTTSVRSRAYYKQDSEAQSVLAQTGISNPLLLAWELLPYSFVVDWFYPVGNYLESLTAFDGFTLDGGYVSTKMDAAFSGEVGVYNQPGYPFRTVSVGGSTLATGCRYTRTLSTLNYVPQLRSPIGGEPLDRFATAMSLLVNLFQPTRASSRQREL